MSKGAPKKPEFGPCQEQHGNLNLIDSKMFAKVMGFMFLAMAMGPVINAMKAYSNSTTAATLP